MAENADFARMCQDTGIVFIGPPADSIRAMGSKTEARAIMSNAGIPVVPGGKAIDNIESALQEAERIGYPVMIKAAYGGGGKGMRIIYDAKSLKNGLESASREAEASFGDGTVYLEKYLLNPRHIEIQILADNHGNVIHLGERECSIQRRHQKVIEEAPSIAIDQKTRESMGKAAVQAAAACGYRNAGTVEFMYSQGKFYFLEMNTRLQVEHPVTELVYDVDLVKEQILIAQGEPLRIKQEDITAVRHAIECRIYSEDENFLPDTGTIKDYVVPQGPGVRVDGGVAAGDEITVHYDPMIAKLLTWGEDRPSAISRMKRALTEYRIAGVKTTIPFCLKVMENPAFIAGDYSTGFVEEYGIGGTYTPPDDVLKAVAVATSIYHIMSRERKSLRSPTSISASGTANNSKWLEIGRLENCR